MRQGYRSNADHLYDELARLDLVLRLASMRVRSRDSRIGNPPSVHDSNADGEAELRKQIQGQREDVARKVAASEESSIALRLPWVAQLFGLSPFEYDVLVVCLAPEIDRIYERRYAAFYDQPAPALPTVDLLLQLLCDDPEERLQARESFLPTARLFRSHLLTFTDAAQPAGSLLGCSLRLDPGLAQYLLGSEMLDARLAPALSFRLPDSLERNEPADEREGRLLDSLRRFIAEPDSEQWFCVLHGPDRTSQEELAQVLCARTGLPLLQVDVPALIGGEVPFGQAIKLALREAAFHRAAVLLDRIDPLLDDDAQGSSQRRLVESAIAALGTVIFLAGLRPWYPQMLQPPAAVVECPLPTFAERRHLWARRLNGRGAVPTDGSLPELAARFRLTREGIRCAAGRAQSLADLRDGPACALTPDDILQACRSESSQALRQFAGVLTTCYDWTDLVLPADHRRQLQEIVSYLRHQDALCSDWGFGRKHALRRGVNLLFSGPSGTGKTMAAGILARELGLELYRIDLSTVVSKYIGETEKQLSRIFEAAETSNAILFFDEADALFGKRSEVKDAHDRYANIEVNYLLQKLEEHNGVVILASNLSKNLDDAFQRRLQFTVLFPMPEQEERLAIWRQVFPQEAPLAQDLDFEFLARRFKLTGGSIKNIALTAAFFARADGAVIGMRHVILAIKREFQKMGRLCQKADFGDYYGLVC